MKRQALLDTVLMWLAVAVVLGLCHVASGQLTVLPTPGKFAGYVASKEPGGWLVVKDGFTPINATVSADHMSVVWEGDAGTYGVIFFQIKNDIVIPQIQQVVLGGASHPDPPPVPPGARKLVILEESKERTIPQAVLFDQLVLKYPGKFQYLDKDRPDAQKYVKLIKTTTWPVLLVLTETDQLVRVVSVPSSVDAVDKELNR